MNSVRIHFKAKEDVFPVEVCVMLWKSQEGKSQEDSELCSMAVSAEALGFVELLSTAFKRLFCLGGKKNPDETTNIKMPPMSDLQRKGTIQHSNLQIHGQRKHGPNKGNAALTLSPLHCSGERLYCLRVPFEPSPSAGQKPRCHRGDHVAAPPTLECQSFSVGPIVQISGDNDW